MPHEPSSHGGWPLNPKQQKWVAALAGFLVCEILASGCGVYKLVPDQLRCPISWQVLRWVGLGGLLGGAARALLFLKMDLTNHGEDKDVEPQWYLDRWPFYLAKPFLGAAGGLASYLCGYVAFQDSFTDPQMGPVRTLGAALAGGMFFEGAFSQLQALIPERKQDGK